MAVSHFSEAMQPYILSLYSLFPTMSLCLRQNSQLFNPVAWYEHMQFTGVLLSLRQGLKCSTELAASLQPIGEKTAPLFLHSWATAGHINLEKAWEVELGHKVGGNVPIQLLFCLKKHNPS